MESGAAAIKKLNMIGATMKNAKDIPNKNKTMVESIKGAIKSFSFSNKPGATKIQIWRNR